MTFPPQPSTVSIPATLTGSALQNESVSVRIDDGAYVDSLVTKTNGKVAMIVDGAQRVSVNSVSSSAMLTVNNDISTVPTIRLSYQNQHHFDGWIDDSGSTIFNPSGPSTSISKNVNIHDHDGIEFGLQLNSVLVTASATELNYLDVPVGVAVARKALVTDGSKNVLGIGRISANEMEGVLITGSQPNISSLKTVNITSELSIGGVPITVDPVKFSYLDVPTPGQAYPDRVMVLDGDKSINGLNSVRAASVEGTLLTSDQPNITKTGSLTSLSVDGPAVVRFGASISTSQATPLRLPSLTDPLVSSSIYTNDYGDLVMASSMGSNVVKIADGQSLQVLGHDGATKGLILGNVLVTATASQINRVNATQGLAAPGKAMVLDVSKNISGIGSLAAESIRATVETPSQPYITSVNTLDITEHDGIRGLCLAGSVVTSSAEALNRVDTTPGVAVAGKALVFDASRNITGIKLFESDMIAGTVLTYDQPYIQKVTTLQITGHDGSTQGLKLGETLVIATASQLNSVAVSPGTAGPKKALVLDSAKNISGINDLSAVNVHGTIQTNEQPNIELVNVLNVSSHDGSTRGLSLNGTLVKATAVQVNALVVQNGVAVENKALVLNSSRNISGINTLSASNLSGLVVDPSQPNIASVNVLDITTHDGEARGLRLKGDLVTSTASQLNYVDVDQGVGAGSKALVLDPSRNISGINHLSASQLDGVLQTESQPNLTRVNTLNVMSHNGSTSGLALNGVLVKASASQINRMNVQAGVAIESGALVVDADRNIRQLNVVSASRFDGLLSSSSQPFLTEVQTLNVAGHNGVSAGLSLNGELVMASAFELNRVKTIAGAAEAGRAMVLDNNRSIQNIQSLTADTLTGTIQTPRQPNIEEVSILHISNHDGGNAGLSLNGELVTADARQLNYTTVVPGSATAMRALVMNEYNSISGINQLQATKLTADQFEIKGVVSNFNTGGLLVKSYSFTDLIGRVVDVQIISGMSFVNFQPANMTDGYSSEFIGYIRPRFAEMYTFYVSCNDRVRMWVNGSMILHSWTKVSTSRTSAPIFLNAEQWVPIFIQYQVDNGSTSSFNLEWISISTERAVIPSTRLAWDNNPPAHFHKPSFESQMVIFNALTAAENSAVFKVDISGDLTIDASGNDINLGTGDSLNIAAHDGLNSGLRLAGVLVKPTAYELNYLKVSPGVVSTLSALVVDSSKSITGINSLSATSIACQNLSTSAFTISKLALTGPLNNYNSGGIVCRQFTGSNFQGRVVDVSVLTDISLNGYDPKELNTNFSVDIIGFVIPTYTETYRFHALTNDKVRIWVNSTLILNQWRSGSYLEYTSTPISLAAGKWTRIYIQFQNKDSTSKLLVRWSSASMVISMIGSSSLAWDNTVTQPVQPISAANRITVFSSTDELEQIREGDIAVDDFGTMRMSSTAGNILVDSGSSFDVAGHNGSTGLKLAGNIVSASAAELNHLAGVTPGSVLPSKAIVLDESRAISGITQITADTIQGIMTTPSQSNITSIGALQSRLQCLNSLEVRNGAEGSSVLEISSTATSTSLNSSLGFTVSAGGNVDALTIDVAGNVGIGMTSPGTAFVVDGRGGDSCVRLVHNDQDESNESYCEIGVTENGDLSVSSGIELADSGSISIDSDGSMNILSQTGVVRIGQSANSQLPLELASTAYSIETEAGYLNESGSVGTMIPESSSYSLRTDGSIIVNGTVCVTSDRRLKSNVKDIDIDRCKAFIKESRPVSFVYSDDKHHSNRYGLIAQEVATSGFADIVNVAPRPGLPGGMDDRGVVSPKDAAFNVSYGSIIPILMATMKEVMNENESLKSQMSKLDERLTRLEKSTY